MLFKTGVSIDDAERNGKTAFLLAAEKGHLQLLDFLIKKGASPDVKDNKGRNTRNTNKPGKKQRMEINTMSVAN